MTILAIDPGPKESAWLVLGPLVFDITALEARTVAAFGEMETWIEERNLTGHRDEARAILARLRGGDTTP